MISASEGVGGGAEVSHSGNGEPTCPIEENWLSMLQMMC
jgi:hypothetical protein